MVMHGALPWCEVGAFEGLRAVWGCCKVAISKYIGQGGKRVRPTFGQ